MAFHIPKEMASTKYKRRNTIITGTDLVVSNTLTIVLFW